MLECLLENNKAVLEGKFELSHVRAEVECGGLGLLITSKEDGIVVGPCAIRQRWVVGGNVLVGCVEGANQFLVEVLEGVVLEVVKLLPEFVLIAVFLNGVQILFEFCYNLFPGEEWIVRARDAQNLLSRSPCCLPYDEGGVAFVVREYLAGCTFVA